jgi:hypothetical protein
MAYRFHPKFASGSGAAVHAVLDENTSSPETSADSLAAALRPLVFGYRAWITRKAADIDDPGEQLAGYVAVARDNLTVATRAADRIEAGIDLMVRDDTARRAFGCANRAMYLQRVHTQVAANRRKTPSAAWPTPWPKSTPQHAHGGERSCSLSCC